MKRKMACLQTSNGYIVLMLVVFIIVSLSAVILGTIFSQKDKPNDYNIEIILGLDVAILVLAFITFFYMLWSTLSV